MHKETDQTISEKSYHRTIKTDSEQKEIGQAVKTVEGNAKTTVGRKKTTHILGDSECVTAGNTMQGIGGDFTQRVQGVASLIAKGKLEQKGQTVWTGSEGVNGWAILEELLQIIADMGQTLASHMHRVRLLQTNKDRHEAKPNGQIMQRRGCRRLWHRYYCMLSLYLAHK